MLMLTVYVDDLSIFTNDMEYMNTKEQWVAAKKLRYLKGTIDKELKFAGDYISTSLKLLKNEMLS